MNALLLSLLLPACAAAPVEHMTEAAADPALKAGLRSLYALEYAQARQAGETFRNKHPANPLGHLYIAGALWWEVATEAWARPGASTAQLWRRFGASVDATLESSQKLIKSDDARLRADGYFAAGMALGLRGQMKLVSGKFFGAYRDGKKGIKFLRKAIKIDPNYDDAYMGLGIFDYQVAVLPGVLKFGAKLLFRGTQGKEVGLQRIRRAVDRGRFASKQASSFLLTLLVLYEKNWEQALAETRALLAAFPDSAYYRGIEVMLLHRAGRVDASLAEGRALFADLARDPEDFKRKLLGTVCGIYGQQCLREENLRDFEVWASNALAAAEGEAPRDESFLLALRVGRGLTRDMLGRHDAAKSDYGKAMDLPEFGYLRRWAQRCWTGSCAKPQLLRVLAGQAAGPSMDAYELVAPGGGDADDDTFEFEDVDNDN